MVLRLARDFANLGHLDLMDIISLAMGGLHIGTYAFDGYVADMGSAAEYLKASMDLQDRNVRRELFNPDRQIMTKVHDTPPALYADGSLVRSSLVASGSIIEGTVENSVLFRGVHVGKGSHIKNSVVMQGSSVGERCEIEHSILDKSVTVRNESRLVAPLHYPIVVGKNTVI